MSDLSVTERRLRPIQDAVATSNWKQALQQCDKWSKKGEASDRFLALKAFVLVNQPEASQQHRGVSEANRLCTRTPAITDIAALHQLQDTLKKLSLSTDEGSKIWDRAAAAKPHDKDLLMTWIKRSISENDWLSAQKATMALRKAFPQERKYDFWNILMCYLIKKDTSLADKDRTLFGMLAFRMISKAAEAVPKDKAQLLSSGKAVQTPEELFLLTKIYITLGHAQEAVQLLRSENFGLESRFAEQDSQLIMSLLLETLEASEQWTEVFDFCSHLVVEEKYQAFDSINDDRVWHLLFKAAKRSDQTVYRQRLQDMVTHRLEQAPNLRSARQAAFLLSQDNLSLPQSHTDLLAACQLYYDQFATEGFCFDDLKQPLSRLDASSRDEFLKMNSSGARNAVKSSEIYQSILNLKLQYCFNISTTKDVAVIRAFSAKALQLYSRSTEQRNPLPEACLVAALTLVEVGLDVKQAETTRTSCLLQATVILTGCCQDFSEYYPGLVLLVRLQLRLGLMSSAMMNFKKLSVKNMQWETMGHLILTRISTLHPLQYGKITPNEDTGFNPLEALDLTLEVAENAGRSLARHIMEGLSCSSYVNVAESVRMKFEMEQSLNRQMAALEEKRIQRLRGIFDDTSLPSRPERLVDKRDMSSFCDFAISDSMASRNSFCGPFPGKVWLESMSLQDEVCKRLTAALQSQSGAFALPTDHLSMALNRSNNVDVFEGEELTATEHHNHECHRLVAEAILIMSEALATEQAKLDEIVDMITGWLQGKCTAWFSGIGPSENLGTHGAVSFSRVRDIATPSWEYLHSSFSKLETLQLLSLFAAVASKRSKGSKPKAPAISKVRITNLQQLVLAAQAEIHDVAKQLKDGLNAPGVLGKLVDLVLGRSESEEGVTEPDLVGIEIEKLCDAAKLETLCGEMKESWEDAADGILAVKIKAFT